MSNDWAPRISESDAERLLALAQQSRFLAGKRAFLVHDLSRMRSRIDCLRRLFPERTLHAVAIKANPLIEVLRVAVAAGAGLEAASFEELHLARAAGCAPERLVFDSPAKTVFELEQALELGVTVNANSLDELARIDAIFSRVASRSQVGLRINPQVGSGNIRTTSVALAQSKFGVPLQTGRSAIVAAFARYPWLTGLHSHIGSQGFHLTQLLQGVQSVADFASEIDAELGVGHVLQLDIGGGLPAQYRESDTPPSPCDYVAGLRARVPRLFESSAPTIITEFGRAIQAGCGFAASRVEYVTGDQPIVSVHFGADLFLRTAYQPEHWRHEILVFDALGRKKQGPLKPHTIVGPLCFSGDVLAQDCLLPSVDAEDWIVIRDAGAYTLGLWSRHCSRGIPLVLGYDGSDELCVLREAESPSDVVNFWSR